MIYLHKILPLLVLPSGLAFLLLLAGLVSRRRALCWAGMVLLGVSSTPLVSTEIIRAAEGWQTRQPVAEVPSAHAIVVLSYGMTQPPGDSDATEWLDPDRFFGGVELFKADKAPLLVFTGGWVPWRPNARPEGEVLADYAVSLGVPRDRIRVTRKVSNTEEEGVAVAELLSRDVKLAGVPRVLLVTSAYHMRRARLLFTRAGIDAVPFPVDFKVSADRKINLLDFVPGVGSLDLTDVGMRELYGLAYYRFLRQ